MVRKCHVSPMFKTRTFPDHLPRTTTSEPDIYRSRVRGRPHIIPRRSDESEESNWVDSHTPIERTANHIHDRHRSGGDGHIGENTQLHWKSSTLVIPSQAEGPQQPTPSREGLLPKHTDTWWARDQPGDIRGSEALSTAPRPSSNLETLGLVVRAGTITSSTPSPMDEFPGLFKGLGRLNQTYTIKLRQGATPFAQCVTRRAPFLSLSQ